LLRRTLAAVCLAVLVAAPGVPGAARSARALSATITSPAAPQHVVAVQGPVQAPSVLVTWERSDPSATAYEIYRDGTKIATTTVSGDPWDDLSYQDTVTPSSTHVYQVRAVSPAGDGDLSAPFGIRVRGSVDVGSGRIFRVDNYTGTDLQRATAAIAAAHAAGGGVVRFGARTYVFDQTLVVAGDDVVLQGAGIDQTFIQPGFAGTAGACDTPAPLIAFRGQRTRLSVTPAAPITVGARTVTFAAPPPVAPGQVLVFDESQPQAGPFVQAANGIVQDPGTGSDDRYRWDANEVLAVSGSTVTFKYPFSQPFTTAVRPQLIASGYRDGIERLTLQGRGANETTYYQLLLLDQVAKFAAADVRQRPIAARTPALHSDSPCRSSGPVCPGATTSATACW